MHTRRIGSFTNSAWNEWVSRYQYGLWASPMELHDFLWVDDHPRAHTTAAQAPGAPRVWEVHLIGVPDVVFQPFAIESGH